jgi:hypothetical protein
MSYLFFELDHLGTSEQELLLKVLQKHDTLFGGGLGELIKPIHLRSRSQQKPYHARYFPGTHAYEANTQRSTGSSFCGVMERTVTAMGCTILHPEKETGDIRVLTDFRRLNAVLLKKPFPLPKI